MKLRRTVVDNRFEIDTYRKKEKGGGSYVCIHTVTNKNIYVQEQLYILWNGTISVRF